MATTATVAGRLATLGGCGRFAEVVEGPADRAELERAVASGAVRRVHRGCYCLPGTSAAVVAATVFRAVVTCVSAADLYGLTVLDPPDRVHLSVPRRRGTSRPGLRDQDAVVLHREASSPQPHPHPHPPPHPHPHPHPQLQPSMVRVAPPASALARVLQCQPGDLAVVTVDSAVNRRLVTVDELRAALPPGAGACASRPRTRGRAEPVAVGDPGAARPPSRRSSCRASGPDPWRRAGRPARREVRGRGGRRVRLPRRSIAVPRGPPS